MLYSGQFSIMTFYLFLGVLLIPHYLVKYNTNLGKKKRSKKGMRGEGNKEGV